jgi:hypothetical protein
MAKRENTFLIKRSNVPGKVPLPGDLQLGELALNTADVKLYTTGTTENDIIQIGWDRIHRTGDTVNGDFIFNGDVTVTGTTNLNTVTASTISSVEYIDFDINQTNNAAEGRLFWDFENSTLNFGMGGGNVTQKIGEDTFYFVKNQTGTQINKGIVVRAIGTAGSSSRILIDLAIADNTISDKYIMGIAAENIPNGDDGFVNEFGLVRGIDTTGSLYGETWVDGTVLYVSSTILGGLTSVEPQAPNQKVVIALVINANVNGSLFVRPTFLGNIGDIYNVQNSGQTNGDLLIYNSGNTTWEYSKTFNGAYTFNNSLTLSGLTTNNTLGDILVTDSNGFIHKRDASTISGGSIGTGTTNFVSKWTGTNTQGDSQIFDDGTYVGIGTTSPQKTLSINGDIRLTRSTTNSDIVATNFHSGLYFGNNLQYAGAGEPILSANTSYIDGVGASNRGGTLLFTRANSETIRGLYFYTAPNSTGAGDPATLTEQFRVTPTSGFFRNKLSVGLIGVEQTALLNIRAQGSLSSDEVLKVRNNADTINNFVVLGNGRTEFRANAIASAPEVIANFRIEDSTSSLSIQNFTNTDGAFIPTIVGDQQGGELGAMSIIGRITSEHDTGTAPVLSMSTRIGNTDPVAVRPLFRFRNFTTDVFQVNADRSITITNTIKAYSGGGQLNLRDNNVNNSWSLTSDNGNYGTGSAWIYGLSNNGTQVGYQIDSETIGLGVYNSSLTITTGSSKEIVISNNKTSNVQSANLDNRAIFIGARNSTINSGITNSVIIGGTGVTATQNNTVYIGNELEVRGEVRIITIDTDNELSNILVTDSNGVVHKRDVSTIGGSSRVTGSLATTDNTEQTLLTINTLTAESTHVIEVFITTKDSNDIEYGSWKRTLVVNLFNGTVTIPHENADLDIQTSNFTTTPILFSISGTSVLIRVIGINATNLQWNSTYDIVTKSTN